MSEKLMVPAVNEVWLVRISGRIFPVKILAHEIASSGRRRYRVLSSLTQRERVLKSARKFICRSEGGAK